LRVRQKVDGSLTGAAELPLAGEAVRVAVAAFSDVVGLERDGSLDGGRLTAGVDWIGSVSGISPVIVIHILSVVFGIIFYCM
jgi:hypothetical protein